MALVAWVHAFHRGLIADLVLDQWLGVDAPTIGFLVGVIYFSKYGWQRAPAEIWRRSRSFASFLAAGSGEGTPTVQRHATWTPDRRPILTPLSREPISC